MTEQVLRNTGATLEVDFSAGAADGAVTVTITRADGTALVSGAATTPTGTPGTYAYTLAPQTELDSLTVRWNGSWGGVAQSITTYVDIVGDHLFTTEELRNFGDRALASTSTYPDTDLRAARSRITDFFNQVCAVSFIPRYARDVLDGLNSAEIALNNRRPTRLIAGSMNGVALTSEQLAQIYLYVGGRAVWRNGYWSANGYQNVVLSYEHGYKVPPADISRAAMILARYELVSNDISDRMVSFDNDLGTVRLSVPGNQYPTGIPIVDATLARYDECALLIA